MTLHQYDLSGNKVLAEMKHHEQSCRALRSSYHAVILAKAFEALDSTPCNTENRFTADGSTLFTGSTDASIGAYDMNVGKLSAVLSQFSP